ncbi:MAG: hypothetical protein ACREJM_08715, partial [Candidatus Saccharimonadales bacterium]
MNKFIEGRNSIVRSTFFFPNCSMPSKVRRVSGAWFISAALAALALTVSVQAMTINVTYDSSVTSQANAGQIESAFADAAQTFQDLYTNAVTVNVTVFYQTGIGLAQSSTEFTGNPSYSDLINALRASASTAADTNSIASLPVSDPTSGPWWVANAQAKALGPIGGIDYVQSFPDGDGS